MRRWMRKRRRRRRRRRRGRRRRRSKSPIHLWRAGWADRSRRWRCSTSTAPSWPCPCRSTAGSPGPRWGRRGWRCCRRVQPRRAAEEGLRPTKPCWCDALCEGVWRRGFWKLQAGVERVSEAGPDTEDADRFGLLTRWCWRLQAGVERVREAGPDTEEADGFRQLWSGWERLGLALRMLKASGSWPEDAEGFREWWSGWERLGLTRVFQKQKAFVESWSWMSCQPHRASSGQNGESWS